MVRGCITIAGVRVDIAIRIRLTHTKHNVFHQEVDLGWRGVGVVQIDIRNEAATVKLRGWGWVIGEPGGARVVQFEECEPVLDENRDHSAIHVCLLVGVSVVS